MNSTTGKKSVVGPNMGQLKVFPAAGKLWVSDGEVIIQLSIFPLFWVSALPQEFSASLLIESRWSFLFCYSVNNVYEYLHYLIGQVKAFSSRFFLFGTGKTNTGSTEAVPSIQQGSLIDLLCDKAEMLVNTHPLCVLKQTKKIYIESIQKRKRDWIISGLQ